MPVFVVLDMHQMTQSGAGATHYWWCSECSQQMEHVTCVCITTIISYHTYEAVVNQLLPSREVNVLSACLTR